MKIDFDKMTEEEKEELHRKNSLHVYQLINYLKQLDPNAVLVYGEQNGAMLGEGYWQHMVDFMLPQCIRTVKQQKERDKQFYVQDRMSEQDKIEYTERYNEAVKKDYKYVRDDDIIITI